MAVRPYGPYGRMNGTAPLASYGHTAIRPYGYTQSIPHRGSPERGRNIPGANAMASTAISSPSRGSVCTPTTVPAGGLRGGKYAGPASRITWRSPGWRFTTYTV